MVIHEDRMGIHMLNGRWENEAGTREEKDNNVMISKYVMPTNSDLGGWYLRQGRREDIIKKTHCWDRTFSFPEMSGSLFRFLKGVESPPQMSEGVIKTVIKTEGPGG